MHLSDPSPGLVFFWERQKYCHVFGHFHYSTTLHMDSSRIWFLMNLFHSTPTMTTSTKRATSSKWQRPPLSSGSPWSTSSASLFPQKRWGKYIFWQHWSFPVGVLVLLPERDRPAGDPPLLLLLDPQPPQLALLPRPPGKGGPDLSDPQDP